MADKLPDEFDWRAFTPQDSPLTPMEVMADEHIKRLTTPTVEAGEQAYNFTSPIYDFSAGHEAPTGRHFDLFAVAKEKPVALIFGSYT